MGLILVSSVTKLVRLPNAIESSDLSLTLTIGALAVLFAQLALTGQRRIVQLSSCVSVALIPFAVWGWDARTPWTRFLESPAPPPAELASLLPQKASVYWEDGIEMLWLRLKRPSYFSCDQGTGALFHRETALTYKHRADSFWPLRTGDFTQSPLCPSFDKTRAADRTQSGLQSVCTREPGLDYLVLSAPLEGVRPKIWKPPVPYWGVHFGADGYTASIVERFYIYSCAQARATARADAPAAAVRRVAEPL
jgi:hypothetical protein